MANTYDVGDLPRISAVFTTAAGVDTDPTVVKFVYQTPGGTTTTLTYGVDAALVRDSAGHYHVDLSLTEAGTWMYSWYSTGIGQAAEGSWLVAVSLPVAIVVVAAAFFALMFFDPVCSGYLALL